MGVDELTEDPLPVDEDMTIEMLCQIYGREAVRRGLSYITNLQNAEESYKKAANSQKSAEFVQKTKVGVKGGGDPQEVNPEELPERAQEAQSAWEKGMEKSGLGIEDDG